MLTAVSHTFSMSFSELHTWWRMTLFLWPSVVWYCSTSLHQRVRLVGELDLELVFLFRYEIFEPIKVAASSKAWAVLSRSSVRFVGSNTTHDMDICIVCVYCVFLLSCVLVDALRWTDPPSKQSYWLRIGARNWKSGQGPTKGCRVIIIIILLLMI
jgi:hypothetical protein